MEKQKKNRKMMEDKENKLSQAKELRMILNKGRFQKKGVKNWKFSINFLDF